MPLPKPFKNNNNDYIFSSIFMIYMLKNPDFLKLIL